MFFQQQISDAKEIAVSNFSPHILRSEIAMNFCLFLSSISSEVFKSTKRSAALWLKVLLHKHGKTSRGSFV